MAICPVTLMLLILIVALLCGAGAIRAMKKRTFGCPHPVYPWLRE